MPHTLVTGATGFLGTHVAEACVSRGHAVSTIARATSDTKRLERLGVTIHRGDLADREVVQRAVEGVDFVIHCAAKVGDWGPVEDYRAVNVEALRGLLEVCKSRPLERFVHISSLGVYAARHHYRTDETEPLPERHMDGYTQTKVESERLVLDYHRDYRIPVVVLRPGFVYGPLDRTVLPQLVDNLRRRTVKYLGSSKPLMNTIYVGNLVDAIFLAIEKPQAVGQVYNLTDGEAVSKRRFMETICTALDIKRPSRIPVPLWFARLLAGFMEWWARLRGATEAPMLTQARIKFLGLNLDYSIERAKRELGYRPRFSFDEGMRETMAWYRQQG
jgi:nucleoside-diphosphate-sugar epimerase